DLAVQAIEWRRAIGKFDPPVVERVVTGNLDRVRLAERQLELERQFAGASDVDAHGRMIQRHVERTAGDIANEVGARAGCASLDAQYRVGRAQVRDVDFRTTKLRAVDTTLVYVDGHTRTIEANIGVEIVDLRPALHV